MKQQLKMLQQLIENMDSNPTNSMQFWTTPTGTTTKTNVPPPNIKEEFVRDCIHRIQHQCLANNDCAYVDPTIPSVIEHLQQQYNRNQHLCWQSHNHHFHPGFFEYVNCPVTCLAEISEFLDKLTKELYHA